MTTHYFTMVYIEGLINVTHWISINKKSNHSTLDSFNAIKFHDRIEVNVVPAADKITTGLSY